MKKRTELFVSLLFLLFLTLPTLLSAQTINVDDPPYNAVGDGVTNDHDAIQDAIWDLRAAGGTLQFTSGKTYIIGSGLTFSTFPDTRDYLVTTTGAAKATIKIEDGAPLTWDHWGIRLSESNNVTVHNLIIDGNRDTRNPEDETSGTDVFFIDGASNGTRLLDLDLINSPADNLYIVVHENQDQDMMTDFEMHNCRLDNGFRNNMSVISGANFKIIGCEFTHANGTDPQSGIDFEPNGNSSNAYSNMTIEGCLFKDNVRYGVELTYIIAGSGTTEIRNSFFENNGLLVASKNNTIHHNIFAKQDHQHQHGDATRDGIIYFHTAVTSTDNQVYNNYFYDNPMPAGSHLIFFMYNAGGNNNVHDNYGHGNTVADFVGDNTNPDTAPQIIANNDFLTRKEMGYWNMDAAEIAGNTINDLSDFNHDGTITGATSVTGVENEALDFAPDDRYIAISANDNLNIEMNFTVMAWIKWAGVNNAETQQMVVGRGDDWRFGVNNSGQIGLYAADPFTADWVQSPANAIPTDQWKLVTATYNGRRAKIFVDDVEVADEKANGALGTALAHLYIGSFGSDTYSFNGIIDDVRLYNYSLSQVEIQAIFNAAPLSVEWISPLTVTKRKGGILLSWTIADQNNNDYFDIEHSENGVYFEKIGEISGDGYLSATKTLRFLHKNPHEGINYYRIKQVDFDGKYEYSNIVSATIKQATTVTIFPNPVRDELHLQTDFPYDFLEIYDYSGKRLLTLMQKTKAIDVSQLPKGIYILRVIGDNRTVVQRFVIE